MMSRMLKKTWVVCLLASVSCFFWGSAFPGIKIGYEWFRIGSLDAAAQILFAGCRFFLAGLMVILFGSLMSRELLRPKTLLEWKHATIISMFQTILQYVLFYIGLANTAGTKASIIVGSNVFIAILFTTVCSISSSHPMMVSISFPPHGVWHCVNADLLPVLPV